MCRKITWFKIIKFRTYKMLFCVVKRLSDVTICKLMWFVLLFALSITVWMYYDLEEEIDENGPKVDAKYPVILWWTDNFGFGSTKYCPNNIRCYVYRDKKKDKQYNVGAYLFYASTMDFKDLPLPRRPNDVYWGLYHEESPRNVEEFLHEQALNIFNFSSTFSRYSDTPFPLQYMKNHESITSTIYFVKTSLKNDYLKEISPVMYLQSDCETSTERDDYVKELMKYIDIDSYGKCLNNKEMSSKFREDYLNNLDENEFLNFVARYKFVVAIENGVCNDYITEKFWRAIKVGTVPIYFGSPTIRDWLPNKKSAILLEDYPSPKILAEHIKLLLSNDTLYEEYLEHKTKQIITNEKLINEFKARPYQIDTIKTVEEFECFICEKLHLKQQGDTNIYVVNKSHYDCPKPLSALTLNVNPHNHWVYSWESSKLSAEKLYNHVMIGD